MIVTMAVWADHPVDRLLSGSLPSASCRPGADDRQRLLPDNEVAPPEKVTDPFAMRKLSHVSDFRSVRLVRFSRVDDQLERVSLKLLDLVEP